MHPKPALRRGRRLHLLLQRRARESHALHPEPVAGRARGGSGFLLRSRDGNGPVPVPVASSPRVGYGGASLERGDASERGGRDARFTEIGIHDVAFPALDGVKHALEIRPRGGVRHPIVAPDISAPVQFAGERAVHLSQILGILSKSTHLGANDAKLLRRLLPRRLRRVRARARDAREFVALLPRAMRGVLRLQRSANRILAFLLQSKRVPTQSLELPSKLRRVHRRGIAPVRRRPTTRGRGRARRTTDTRPRAHPRPSRRRRRRARDPRPEPVPEPSPEGVRPSPPFPSFLRRGVQADLDRLHRLGDDVLRGATVLRRRRERRLGGRPDGSRAVHGGAGGADVVPLLDADDIPLLRRRRAHEIPRLFLIAEHRGHAKHPRACDDGVSLRGDGAFDGGVRASNLRGGGAARNVGGEFRVASSLTLRFDRRRRRRRGAGLGILRSGLGDIRSGLGILRAATRLRERGFELGVSSLVARPLLELGVSSLVARPLLEVRLEGVVRDGNGFGLVGGSRRGIGCRGDSGRRGRRTPGGLGIVPRGRGGRGVRCGGHVGVGGGVGFGIGRRGRGGRGGGGGGWGFGIVRRGRGGRGVRRGIRVEYQRGVGVGGPERVDRRGSGIGRLNQGGARISRGGRGRGVPLRLGPLLLLLLSHGEPTRAREETRRTGRAGRERRRRARSNWLRASSVITHKLMIIGRSRGDDYDARVPAHSGLTPFIALVLSARR